MARRGDIAELSWLAKDVLRKLRVRNAHAAVFLLSGREMAALKRKCTRKTSKKTVDVLAFPEPAGFPHPEAKKRPLGEVYINANIARRDPVRARHLLVHGILHLLGYTHESKGDTLKMEKLEKKLLLLLNPTIGSEAKARER